MGEAASLFVCRSFMVCRMSKQVADLAAHYAIPDDCLECIYTRRHSFPSRRLQRPQKIKLSVPGGEPLDLVEYYSACTLCGTTRTMFRFQLDDAYAWAEYTYPAGYLAPVGYVWDRGIVRDEWRRRFPVTGKVRIVKRG